MENRCTAMATSQTLLWELTAPPKTLLLAIPSLRAPPLLSALWSSDGTTQSTLLLLYWQLAHWYISLCANSKVASDSAFVTTVRIDKWYLLTYLLYICDWDRPVRHRAGGRCSWRPREPSVRTCSHSWRDPSGFAAAAWVTRACCGWHTRGAPCSHPSSDDTTPDCRHITSRHQVSKCQVLSFNISASE